MLCVGTPLDLSTPKVMGILNLTPDSFSDGNKFQTKAQAIRHAITMAEAGAAIIDIGGESTTPGAPAVSIAEELDRVIPIIDALHNEIDIPISIDTSKPEVMQEAIKAGASMINDVCALQQPDALEMAAQLQVPICLTHMQGSPRTMQQNPQYNNVIQEVREFLQARITACTAAGIAKENLIIDPGFGFGKTVEHNLSLVANTSEFTSLGVPVLFGFSRKSTLGKLLNAEVDQRLAGGLALAVIAAQNGAKLIRTHDVKPTVEALTIWLQINQVPLIFP